MGRYSGTLANLVEEAIGAGKPSRSKSSSVSRTSIQNTWNKVLHYLENHSTTDGAIECPEFESPLPPFSVPSETLDEQLLERKFGLRQDNTILKLAVTAAPAPVVAALCHLQPHAARIPDHRGKLPLHVACRRNPNDVDTVQIFEILLAVYVEALAHRDSAGRTPLHCLFMYHHAPHRSVETIQKFCQPLPPKLIESLKQPQPHANNIGLGAVNTTKDHHHDLDAFPLPEVPNPSNKDKVPPIAAVIPDARHGALPLHYAVMEGASRDVLRYLLQVYPESKRLVDRKGRTPLAWYLGAGHATTTTSSGAGAKLLVTGEPTDPHTVSWWDKNKIESATVQILLNSRSARMVDGTGRSPLHWAICTLARNHYYLQHSLLKQQGPSVSMKTIDLLLDHYMEGLTTGDLQEKTPLHLLFDSVKEVQEQEWKRLMRNKAKRNDLELKHGGRKTRTAVAAAATEARNKKNVTQPSGPTGNFAPPMELLEILLSSSGSSSLDVGPSTNTMMEDKSAVFIEDAEGRLPIHAAMEVASSPDVIKMLIKAHPTSLVHTTEALVSPLHAAVLSPYVAPLQTPETMRLILRAYVASRHGTYVDGRLALKMEDADGNYPIHYACKNQVCLEVLQMFVEEYPKCALFQTADGNLPLHALLDEHVFEGHPDGMPALGASLANSNTWSSPKEEEYQKEKLSILQQKIRLLLDPILNSNHVQDFLSTPSFDHGMLPLHIVVAWGAASYTIIKRMLDRCPVAAEKHTSVDGHEYSPLDLHENYKVSVVCSEMTQKMDQEWQHIRELLFSFSPLLEGHRHFPDILTQSVGVVRAEIGHALNEGERSYHWTVEQDLRKRKFAPPIEMSETFTSIEVPDIDHGGRPLSQKAILRSRQPITPNRKKTPKNSSSQRPAASTNTSNNRSISRSQTNGSGNKKSIYDDDALDTGYIVSDGEHSDTEDFEEDYFSGPESVEEYLSDESDERFDSFDDEEYSDPTLTTATGSWDTSGAAEPATTSKESANRRNQTQEGAQEEKKENEKTGSAATPKRSCGPQFSEVGMRLLTFFILYCDEKNPSDNYASLAERIFDEVSRSVVDEVISMPLPVYASQYLEEGARMDGLTLREVASPKCRELIHKLFYFLGRFDFRSETGGILLNKTADSSAIQVRSTEWTFSTEEYNEAPELEPGVAEAQVWETGVIPPEEVGYMGATFKAMRRSICFFFTKNAQAYHNEVTCRTDLGVAIDGGAFSESHIVPLISHFDATSKDRKQDRMYKNDSNNESFTMLDMFGQKGNPSCGESICLADYPYALVFPYSNYGDLFDYFFRHGVDGMEETREICTQIGKSLSSMHEKGIIHGNVAMRNIVLFPPVEDVEVEEGRKHWALTNLSGAFRLQQDSNSYMGKVSTQGLAGFHSAFLPPEMFVKLTNEEIKCYKEYWEFVEKEFGTDIDRSVLEPVMDYQSGASYVMRCHFVPSDEHPKDAEKTLPPLPYKLLPARDCADIWAFGQLLFMLCSGGRPLFPTNARTGNLLNYKEICEWDMQAAEAMVYEYVDNPLAQDILLRLLAPYEKRASLAMDTLLNHPFFNDGGMSSSVSRAIAEKRNQASITFRRWLDNKVNEKSEEGFLKERTITISCWDFDFQTRIHLTPTALVHEFLSLSGDQLGMPCGFLILPYKLVRNKKGVLTPPSKRDVERAERLGLRMLALSKACHFVTAMKKRVAGINPPLGWSFAAIFDSLGFGTEDFHDLRSRFAQLSSEHVELFRSEPLQVGLKLIQEQIKELLACYEGASKVSLFLVDEYKGVPTIGPSSAPFPHLVQSSMRCEVARHGLPFMYLCARYFRAISGIPGFVKLIFEAASPHVPPSWQPVCKGLDNSLDHESIVADMTILCDALAASSNSSIEENFEFMQKYIFEVDQSRMYANLKRVSCGEASVWTGPEGVKDIQEAAKDHGFKQAIEAKIKTDQKLMSQQARIKELEEELEKLKFRNNLALQVPDIEAPPPALTSLSKPIFSPSGLAAELYQRGMKCMEANVDFIASRKTCHANAVADEPTEPMTGRKSGETGFARQESDCSLQPSGYVQPESAEEMHRENDESQTNSFETPESSPPVLTETEDELITEAGARRLIEGEAKEPIEQVGRPVFQEETLSEAKVLPLIEQEAKPAACPPPAEQTVEKLSQAKTSSYRDRLEQMYRLEHKLKVLGSQAPLTPTTKAHNKNGGLVSLPTTPGRRGASEPWQDLRINAAPMDALLPQRFRESSRAQASADQLEQATVASYLEVKEGATAVPAEQQFAPGAYQDESHDVPSPTAECPANALLSYNLQEDVVSESTNHYITNETNHYITSETTVVAEAEQNFPDSLLENLSFECIGIAKREHRPERETAPTVPPGQYSGNVEQVMTSDSQGEGQVENLPESEQAPHNQPPTETLALAHATQQVLQQALQQHDHQNQAQELFLEKKENSRVERQHSLFQPCQLPSLKKAIKQQEPPMNAHHSGQPPQHEDLQVQAQPMQEPPTFQLEECEEQQAQPQSQFQAQQQEQLAQLATLKQQMIECEPRVEAQRVTQSSATLDPKLEPSPFTVDLVHEPLQAPEQQLDNLQCSLLEPQVDSCFIKLSDGAEEVKTLLDDMFAEAEMYFSPAPCTPRSNQASPHSPRWSQTRPSGQSDLGASNLTSQHFTQSGTSFPATTEETRVEGMESATFLEITHKELSELKQTLMAGRAAAKESKVETSQPDKSSLGSVQQETGNFHTELETGSKVDPPTREAVGHNGLGGSNISNSPIGGIVGRDRSIPLCPKLPRSNRDPSEVASSL